MTYTPRCLLVIPALKIVPYSEKARELTLDGIIYDLEDSINDAHKEHARTLLNEYVKTNRPQVPIFIRINSPRTSHYVDDWKTIHDVQPDGVALTKIETAEEMVDVLWRMRAYEKQRKKKLHLFIAIETLKGYRNAQAILSEAPSHALFTIGYEDLCSELGIDRPALDASTPLNTILIDCLIYAKEKKITMLDAVSRKMQPAHLADFRREVEYGKSIGLNGKIAIHPNQVPIIMEIHNPKTEILKAEETLTRFSQLTDGTAVIVNTYGEMEDTPSLKRAQDFLKKS